MKRGVVALLSFLFLFAFSTSTLAAENSDVEKATQIINDTNAAIDQEIQKTVENADKLQQIYFYGIQSVQGADAILSLRTEQSNLEEVLLNTTDQAKADEIKARLSAIDTEVANLETTLSKKSKTFAIYTTIFHAGLDKLIADLDQKTRAMSAEGIQQAAELGVQAECEFKLVKIAHKWVWIDPIIIVGV